MIRKVFVAILATLWSGVAIAAFNTAPSPYPTHAALLSAVTSYVGPTISQSEFYAGGGGGSTYVWNPSSYCPTGTSGSPVATDDILCIFPGHAAPYTSSTPGRYILQTPSGGLSVLAVGMAPGGQDNSPYVSALMKAIITPAGGAYGGYTVFFPPVFGQTITPYYFSSPLVLSRGVHLYCPNGTTQYPSITLIFAAGVDGAIQEDGHFTDGGYGVGTIEGCGIGSQGHAVGSAAASATTVTSTSFANSDLSGQIPVSTWSIGDGVFVTPTYPSPSVAQAPASSIPAAPPGTYATNVAGSTITLNNSINAQLGSAKAQFSETGTNNFTAGDSITVGNSTYTFVSTIGSTPGNVLLGKDSLSATKTGAAFLASVTNLENCINNNTTTSTCVAQSSGPNITMDPPTSAVITFWASSGGTGGNSLTSTYTPVGTSAGSFGQATFTGGVATASVDVYQMPVSQAFTIQTTMGSDSVLVTAGPRLLEPGDIVWSDAFPIWTTVLSVSGTLGNQTLIMDQPFLIGTHQNATVTHTSGSPGTMWEVPALVKRHVEANTKGLTITNGMIGLEMPCPDKGTLLFNCTQSGDYDTTYQENLIARYSTGSDYSASISVNESAEKNHYADVADLGALGMTYVNFNAESPESGTSITNVLANCINQNAAVFYGGYFGGGNYPPCASTIGLLPFANTGSGPLIIGPQAAVPVSSPAIVGPLLYGAWQNLSGWSNKTCIAIGGSSSLWYSFGFSTTGCSTATTWGLGWNGNFNAWNLGFTNTQDNLIFASAAQGYTGYLGENEGIVYPVGLLLNSWDNFVNFAGQSRELGACPSIPTLAFHIDGDICLNAAPAPEPIWRGFRHPWPRQLCPS